MYLLDTNVLSELRKAKAGCANPQVVAWFDSVEIGQLYISTVNLLEIEVGVLLKARKDKVQGQHLNQWLYNQIIPNFSGRTLAVDSMVALNCAQLHIPNPASYRDSLVAATALTHGLIVVTRNVDDFIFQNLQIINPWDYLLDEKYAHHSRGNSVITPTTPQTASQYTSSPPATPSPHPPRAAPDDRASSTP